MAFGRVNTGGGAGLNLKWVIAATPAGLPSTAQADTIGFITSITVRKVYPSNETITGLQEGDVVMKQFSPSNTRINVAKTGRFDLYLSGAYQYQNGSLVPIESYLYNGSVWNRIYILFYKNSTYLPIVGGFAAAGASTFTQESDNLKLYMNNTGGWVRGTSMIDLTDINTIWFYGGSSANVTAYLNVSKSTTDNTYGAQVTLPKLGNGWVAMDVSALTGTWYIRFGRGDVAISTTLRCYEWFGMQ